MTDAGDEESKAKSALENEKLRLEKLLLERQLSIPGLLMAWLQAASVPVALLGAILVFFVGFGQLRQGSENQAADRFDKALTRLASKQPDERMTGVSGLQLFLSDRSQLLQKQALQFLINGLSLETDTRVGGAILDVLADLPSGMPSQAALDDGLRTAVERNRSLTKSIVNASNRRLLEQQKQSLMKFKIAGVDSKAIEDVIPAQVISALTTDHYLALLDVVRNPFSSEDDDVPLTGLRRAIQTLVAHGAASRDFEQINCEGCDFTTSKSLDGADFDGAYLSEADFTRVSLRGASFKDADLGGTNFFGADLTKADLRVSKYRYFDADGLFGRVEPSAGRGLFSRGYFDDLPWLECAKLEEADLSGQPLILFIEEFNTTSTINPSYEILMPRMVSVQLSASTKLDSFSILTQIDITDDYLKQHPKAPEVQQITSNRDLRDLWGNPIFNGYPVHPDFRRFHGDFAKEAAKYTSTIATMAFPQVNADTLKRLGGDAFMLGGFVDQPKLKALPLYSRFVDAIKALSAPKGDAAEAAKRRDGLAVGWATIKPLPCAENQPTEELLINRRVE